jgi:transcription elongation factor Elf1
MYVEQFNAKCMVCDRVQSSCNDLTQITPNIDHVFGGISGTFLIHHIQYMTMMVEHFSRWIEMVSLLDKTQ